MVKTKRSYGRSSTCSFPFSIPTDENESTTERVVPAAEKKATFRKRRSVTDSGSNRFLGASMAILSAAERMVSCPEKVVSRESSLESLLENYVSDTSAFDLEPSQKHGLYLDEKLIESHVKSFERDEFDTQWKYDRGSQVHLLGASTTAEIQTKLDFKYYLTYSDDAVFPRFFPILDFDVQFRLWLDKLTQPVIYWFVRYVYIPIALLLFVIYKSGYVVMPNSTDKIRLTKKYKYKHEKRIVFTGDSGYKYYMAGVSALLVEQYGKKLADGVCFDGESGGCFSASLLAICTRGLGSVSEYVGAAIDDTITRLARQEDDRSNCCGDTRKRAEQLYNIASEKRRNNPEYVLSDTTFEGAIKDRLVFWVSDALSMKSIALSRFFDSNYFADALASSCYVPGVMAPSLWFRSTTAQPTEALDGSFARLAGDNSIYEPRHVRNKPIKTLHFEISAPPEDWLDSFEMWRPVDKNRRTIRLWQWESHPERTTDDDPFVSTNHYQKGYRSAQENISELHTAMKWLLEDSSIETRTTVSSINNSLLHR